MIDDDKRINGYQITIEVSCANLLALQQPMVSDLWFVIAIMISCSDLDRMGEHFASIAKSMLRLNEEERLPLFEEKVQKMGQNALEMLHQLLSIFPEHQAKSARELAQTDEKIR